MVLQVWAPIYSGASPQAQNLGSFASLITSLCVFASIGGFVCAIWELRCYGVGFRPGVEGRLAWDQHARSAPCTEWQVPG